MKLTLPEDHVEFDFPKATELFKFDESDKNNPHYHGLSHCMKAVDVVGEFDKFQVWIEIKLFPEDKQEKFKSEPEKKGSKNNKVLTDYINDIKTKYKDTYLYRLCEGKTSTPIFYIFLTNLSDDLCSICQSNISQTLPCGNPIPKRWRSELLDKDLFQVTNFDSWNRNLNSTLGTCIKLP